MTVLPSALEAERLHALQSYDVLDTPPEAAFDDLVALAAQICETPISLVSLIDTDRQWIKARQGVALTETARNISFCTHAIQRPDEIMIVPDATLDSRFAQNPFVTGEPRVRFYAGVPLLAAGGQAIGTLCVIDRRPRILTPNQQEALRVLGRQVMVQLNLRRSLSESALNSLRLRNSQRIAGLGDWEHNFVHHALLWSDEIYRILGLTPHALPPRAETFYAYVHPEDLAYVHEQKKMAAAGLRRVEFSHRIVRPSGEIRHVHQIVEMVFDDRGQRERETGTVQDVTERDRRVQELKEAKITAARLEDTRRYSFLADALPLIVWTALPDGALDYYNKAWFDYTGLTLAQTKDWGWGAVIHPDDLQRCVERWTQSFTSGANYEIEYRFKRGSDGKYRWFLGRASARRDASGRIVQWVGTCTDIDDRKRAEGELRRGHSELESAVQRDITKRKLTATQLQASEMRYRRLFEAAQDGVLILNATTGEIADVNPFLIKLLGFKKEEILGRKIWDLGYFQHLIANQAKFLELQQTDYVRYDDLPLEAADGRRIDVEFVSNVYLEGGIKVIQCNIRDVTARKAAEQARRDSEERFKLVARAVSDVVWDWNLTANSLWWNDGFLTTFGFAAEEVAPSVEFWVSRIHPQDRDSVVASIHRAIDGEASSWTGEYRFQRKDGSYAFVQDQAYVLRDATGKGVRIVGGIRDLTEQKKREAQYLRALRMESIGTLAGGIAHDLNNVLAPILMSIELLKLDPTNSPQRRKLLETILLSSQRGADLVRQVLSFARGSDGERITIRLGDLINDLAGIIRETFPRNIRIVTQVSDELWPIRGEPTQLHQVLLNLAVNARDAMPKGGSLTIAASNLLLDSEAAGTIQEAPPGPYLEVQLTDTGQGIPFELQQRIFEPFFTTKQPGAGTGIGLATVHTIVKSHGGFVRVESEVGKGTTFKVYLPADPTLRSQAPPEAGPIDLARGQGERVLVVDDEPSIRQVAQETLEAFGYRVITAANGAEAVALYAQRSQEIAVILTDMMMPVMDGATAIQKILAINPAARIIASSGLDAKEKIGQTGGVGAKYFLPKPYTTQMLLAVIRKALTAELTSDQTRAGTTP